jgi:Tfp pilus assembly protein PilO
MRFHVDSLITLGIVVALLTGAWLVVYRPQSRQLQAVEESTAQVRGAIQDGASRAAIVPDLVRNISDLRARYTNFDRRLPKQKELGGFLMEISSNLAQERLLNQLIEPGNPTRQDLYHTLPIIMRFQGNYLALASFLDRIDKMERLTRVHRMVLGRSVGTENAPGGPEILNVELQMNIYFTES